MAGIWECVWAPDMSATVNENFGDGSNVQRSFGNSPTIATDALLGSARCLDIAGSFGDERGIEKDGPETATLSWGFRCRITNNGSSAAQFCQLRDSSDGVIFNFLLEPTGTIRARRGTTVLASGGTVPTNDFAYVRFSVDIHDTTGRVRVYVGGTLVIDLTGQDTKNTAAGNAVKLRVGREAAGGGILWRFRDLAVREGFDTIPSPVTFIALKPDGNVSGEIDSTSPTGTTGYEQEDETLADGLTSYNVMDTDGQRNLYTFEQLVQSGGIDAVALLHTCQNPVSGPALVRPTLSISGAPYEADQDLDPGDTVWRTPAYCWRINPATSLPWTAADVNDLVAGYTLVVPSV